MYDFERPRGTEENLEKARKIESHLRLPTLPVAVKFYKREDQIPQSGWEKPDFRGTFCQFLSYARYERCLIRRNYLIEREAITCPFSPGVLGFEEWTGHVATGEHMGGVHFENAEAAKRAQEDLPKLEPHTVKAILVGPLQDLQVQPDAIGFAMSPGMSNKILDGQMWNTGNPKEIRYYNMCGVCGAGLAQAYNKKDLFIGFPCHGARRIGLFTDTELFVALNDGFFDEWILGMEKSYASGHSYPVGHMLRPNPPLPPHFKILEWPDKIVPLSEWEKEQDHWIGTAKRLSSPDRAQTRIRRNAMISDERMVDKTFHFIMRRMVETAQAPFYTDIAAELGVSVEEGRKALHELFSEMIPGWLYPNTDFITSFAPFNHLPTQYRITIEGQQKWFGQ